MKGELYGSDIIRRMAKVSIFLFLNFFAFIKELYDPFVNSGFFIPKIQKKKIFGLVKKTEFFVFFLLEQFSCRKRRLIASVSTLISRC